MDLAQRIQHLRKEKGLSQEELAEALGCRGKQYPNGKARKARRMWKRSWRRADTLPLPPIIF